MRSLALLLVALVVGQPSLAQDSWQVVTSKEGQFSVEMPAAPSMNKSQTRKGANGTIKTLNIGCKAQGALYLVAKTELPTAIVKGAENTELDEARDFFVLEWNGKVMSEKKVNAEGRIGRDFTIRGKPAAEDGVSTIRVRAYVDGKSIYMVAVISAVNRELPDDIGRFLGSLALGANPVRVAARPEPEPKGTLIKGWGTAIDPSQDCEFKPDEKGLALRIPGTWHDLNPESGNVTSPRILRTVEGDFQVTVKVTGEFKPGDKSLNPKSVPYNGAGILIWNNRDNFIRLERGAIQRNGKFGSFALFEEREAGYGGAVHNQALPAGDCYLRIERRGSRISGLISQDGMKWKQLQPIDTLWPTALQVGLSAINSSNAPFALRFEEFSVKTKKKKQE